MASYLGLLVQLCCGEGEALHTNVTGVCREYSHHSGHMGFATTHGCVLSPSTVLRILAAFHRAGPELCALPRPKPLRFRFSGTPQTCRLSWACFLCLPQPRSSGSHELEEHTLPGCGGLIPSMIPASVSAHPGWVHLVSVLGTWSLAMTLPVDVNHPESQEIFG